MKCRIRLVDDEFLSSAPSTYVYIQPPVIAASPQGEVILLGTLNHVMTRDSTPARGTFAKGVIFGAIIGANGRVTLIEPPIPLSRIAEPRVAWSDSGAWDVVFAELDHPNADGALKSASALWHGTLIDSKWEHLERITVPTGTRFKPTNSSNLARRDGRLAWALPLEGSFIGVVERGNAGTWTYERIPDLVGIYPQVALTDSSGLLLAVVHPDRSLKSDGSSLFLWSRGDEWQRIIKIAKSEDGTVRAPVLVRQPSGMVLAWNAYAGRGSLPKREARGTVWQGGRQSSTVAFDSSVIHTDPIVPVIVGVDSTVIVTAHQDAPVGKSEIRFYLENEGSFSLIGAIPNPYLTRFAAVSIGHEIVLSGAFKDDSTKVVASRLLRVRFTCVE